MFGSSSTIRIVFLPVGILASSLYRKSTRSGPEGPPRASSMPTVGQPPSPRTFTFDSMHERLVSEPAGGEPCANTIAWEHPLAPAPST